MVYCAVAGCKNRSESLEKKLRYFSFPRDDKICQQWVTACGKRKSFKIECARICSEHFAQSDFKLQDILLKIPKHKRRLQIGAVPSKNLPNEKRQSAQERKRKKLENKALVEECLASYERKQKEVRSFSGENGGVAEECLASYVSTFLADEIALSPGKKGRTREIKAIEGLCYDSLESFNAERPLQEHSYSQIKYYTNGSTQTELDYECCKELHIMRLEAQNRKLKAVIKKQAIQAQENEVLRSTLRGIMTNGQIKRLQHPGRKLQWKAEDIASAMSLYTAGPKAYALLRRKNFPLPSSSTLRGWAGKIEIKPGILRSVFQLMKKFDYDEKDRVCVLSFNKIRLKSSTYSDKSINMAMTKARFAHVVMLRGLVRDWTQIIYYDFDAPMSAPVLKAIIVELEQIHFVVTAIVSDMGTRTAGLWNEFDVCENHAFIPHPSDELKKIFFFTDVLHLIKLLKNRFVGTGFVLDGKIIDTGPINEILNQDKSALRISREHLDLSKSAREKINLAVELLSESVSTAIKKYTSLNKILSPFPLECADFIKIVSDWFEVFTSKSGSTNSKEAVKAFGLNEEAQRNILASMTETIQNLRATKRQTVLQFQHGILLNNTALSQMLDYVRLNYNMDCIITDRLNHGELECFFNVIRSKGGPQDHPTPLEFKYRLRSYILGKMTL